MKTVIYFLKRKTKWLKRPSSGRLGFLCCNTEIIESLLSCYKMLHVGSYDMGEFYCFSLNNGLDSRVNELLISQLKCSS